MNALQMQVRLRLEQAAKHLADERALNACRHLMNPVREFAGFPEAEDALRERGVGWCVRCEPGDEVEWFCADCIERHHAEHDEEDAEFGGLCPRCEDAPATVPVHGVLALDEPIELWAVTAIHRPDDRPRMAPMVSATIEPGSVVRLDGVATLCRNCAEVVGPRTALVALHWPAANGRGFHGAVSTVLDG